MKLLLTNDDLDRQIKLINKDIQLSMNGITADGMKQSGISYKRNMGVSITRLKEIASEYTAGADLARRLWLLGGRETMILSSLLMPRESLCADEALKMSADIQNLEIAEQMAMNLFSKLEYAGHLALNLIDMESDWQKISGYLTIARIFGQIPDDMALKIAVKATETKPGFHLSRAISSALPRLCRSNSETAGQILKLAENAYNETKTDTSNIILESIRQEMFFLGFKS